MRTRTPRPGHGGRPGYGYRATGRCSRCSPSRLPCRSGWSGRTRRSRTRRSTYGLATWNGPALLHGTPIPPFPSFFSGAPVIYPPLAALADSAGGLAAARILSLVFMLGATALLWATARQLFGRRAAFFAAALFAVLGPTLHLGSFATYDAMSLFLIALASWLVVRAGDRPDATGWMIAAGAALALANATSYPSALFDPVVLVLALLTALPRPGGKLAAARALTLLAVMAVLITLALLIGGSRYLHGIDITTLERAPGTDTPVTVLVHFWSWTGIIVVAAVSRRGHRLGQPRRAHTGVAADPAGGGGAARASPASQPVHHRLAQQARGHGRLVRGHGRGLCGGPVHRGHARGDRAHRHRRRLPGRALLSGRPGRHPVLDVRHQLAVVLRLRRDPAPAGRRQQRATAGRGPVAGRVLPAVRQPVAAMVEHAEHRPALRCPHRRPEHHGRGHRGRQRGHLRDVHRRRATSPWSR